MSANPRIVPLEGLYNVRDLGGVPLAGGGETPWGVFYRAGDLSTPTANDMAALEKLKIATVVDFRSPEERARDLDVLPSTVTKAVRLEIATARIVDYRQAFDNETSVLCMQNIYRGMVDVGRPRFRDFFALLADKRNTPLLFHCAAGKDRTGFAAALLLSALGASKEPIYEDYLMTIEGLGHKYDSWIAARPHLAPVMTVQKSYLDAAWAALEAFGGIETYLTRELDVDIKALRHLYLNPVPPSYPSCLFVAPPACVNLAHGV
jgi:protein-tyrosine phosphatase